MITHGESSSSNTHCVFLKTNFDTRFALPVNYNENISGFKEKICKEHRKLFPEAGEINISALKVKRCRQFFHLSDSMTISMAFEGISNTWFMYVDAVKVGKNDLLAIMDVSINCPNLESLEKKAIGSDSVLADRDTKYLTLEGGLKTEVKKTKKRKIETPDGKRSRKKPATRSQSAVFATSSLDVEDESHEQCGKAQDIERSEKNDTSMEDNQQTSEVDRLCQEKISSGNLDLINGRSGCDVNDVEANQALETDLGMKESNELIKEIERGEINNTNMEENQQTSEVDRLCQEKIPSVNEELINGRSGSDVNDVEANQALETDLGMRESNGSDENHKSYREEVPIEQPDDLQVAEEQDLEKGEETAEIVNTNQDKDLVPNLDTSRVDAKEYKENENERDEGNSLAPSGAANLQTAELVTYPEKQLVDSSDLTTYPTTEKKKKRKKLSNETCATHLLEAMQKENEMGEKSAKVMGRDQIETDNLASHLENHLDANTGLITSPVIEKKRRKKSSKDHNNQSSATATISKENENQKENEIGEKIVEKVGSGKTIPIVAVNNQTNSFVTYPENQLEANSGFKTGTATEKKRKQKKSSKDQIKVSTSISTIPREIVNETKKASESIDPVDATSESLSNPRGEKLLDTLVDTIQIETGSLASHPENHLDALITTPVTEKKMRKKNSKDYNKQSSATATISKETESQKENEIGEKIVDKVGSGKTIPIVAANIQTNSFVTYPENQLEANSGFKTGPATENKRKQKKSSKEINQSTSITTIPREIANETEKASESIDPVDATSESLSNPRGEKLPDTLVDTIQNEKDIGDKFLDNVGPTDNLQVSDLARKPVHESETLKLTVENKTTKHEAAKDSVELSADVTKSVKSTKKTKSRKAKSSGKEDTLSASGAQNVEPINKVVHEEEPDNLIRNVLDSLQLKNETEESLGKIEKKSSKKPKKKDALNIVEAQPLSVVVKNSAPKEVPLISNPKYTDASFTPVKKDTETHLKKSIDVAGNTEETNLSKQIQAEKAAMVDNFDSSQKDDFVGGGKKQDQVSSGVKPSKKEKKNLSLYPSGSIDGSMSSIAPKERRGRVQPASSGTSQLLSRVNNDRSGSKVDHSAKSKKVAIKNKKEAAKKIPNQVTVKKKSSMNFFKDVEWDSTDDESFKRASNVSPKSPSDSSSDNDSDVTSMSRRQANNLPGGTTKGSLQEILRSSRSYKEAKLRASQSQPDTYDDESPPLEFVPDSQAN